MIMKAEVSSKAHPEYGQATISFPIPDSEYDHIICMMENMSIGSPTVQDCWVLELDSPYPILNRLVSQCVNVDELDYLPSAWPVSVREKMPNLRPWPASCTCPTSRTSSTLPSAVSGLR